MSIIDPGRPETLLIFFNGILQIFRKAKKYTYLSTLLEQLQDNFEHKYNATIKSILRKY